MRLNGKKWFCYGNKIRDNKNEFFVASTKNFAAATKRFVYRTKHFVVVTKYFCYPYFNKWLCWYNKTLFFVWGGLPNAKKSCFFNPPLFEGLNSFAEVRYACRYNMYPVVAPKILIGKLRSICVSMPITFWKTHKNLRNSYLIMENPENLVFSWMCHSTLRWHFPVYQSYGSASLRVE